jgi:hypothetical protein
LTASRSTHHEELVGDLAENARRAADAAGGFQDRHFLIAGVPIRLRFAGEAMAAPMTLALAHLESEPVASPELTVYLWDSESTGTPAPQPPWELDDYRERGIVRGYFEEGLYTWFEWGSRTLNVLDSREAEGFFWVSSVDGLGMLDWGSPLRTLLHIWLGERGIQLVHAAAVGRPDGAALLAGNAGTGKSTTALSCLRSELLHIGDDFCVITPGEPPTVWSLYCSVKADDATLARLPELKSLVFKDSGRGFELKSLIDLNSKLPEKLLRSAPLRVVAPPRISDAVETRAVPCPPGVALAAAAPSTMLQLAGADEATMRRLSGFVRSAATYRLDVGSDPRLVPEAIDGMLRR